MVQDTNITGFWVLQVGLEDAAVRLEHSKDAFRDKVKAMLEAFLREIATMQEDYARLAPTNHEGTTSRAALAFVSKWKAAVAAARSKVG